MADFYLGREKESSKDVFLKADSFTTHAFVLGMTGSGKTGLIISILEEAAINNIPAIVIDPKGDLTNRLLVFERMDEETVSLFYPEEKRAEIVERYQKGVAEWGINSDRISSLLKRRVNVITPGISLEPINILERFSPPVGVDEEEIIEKANSVCESLLSLTDKKGNESATSPEGLLLSTILIDLWKKGESVTLETLLKNIVDPPFDKLGILPLETVIPKDKRLSFAVELNGVLCSPTLKYFRTGMELNFDKIFSDPKSETIITLSQLSDKQKIFFLTYFLSELYIWIRRQPGSDRLKMLFIFDEVFGYFPPYPQNPPTKKPILGLLKQARAFGLGLILSTQNPYDVDYKGLSNAGLWFLGRLQTDNDIKRVIDGLNQLPGGIKASSILPQVKQREFVLNDVRKDSPLVFKTRQTISLLAGPLSEPQLRNILKKEVDKGAPIKEMESVKNVVIAPSNLEIKYLKGDKLFPHIFFECDIPFKIEKVVEWKKGKFISPFDPNGIEASLAKEMEKFEKDEILSSEMPQEAEVVPLPQWAINFKRRDFEREIKKALSLKTEVTFLKDTLTGIISTLSEDKELFLKRVSEARKTTFIKDSEKVMAPLLKKKINLETEIEKRKIKVERLKEDYERRKAETYTNAGISVFKTIFGSKRSVLGGIGSTMSKNRIAEGIKDRMDEEENHICRAQSELSKVNQEIATTKNGIFEEIKSDQIREIKVFPYKDGIRVLSIKIVFKSRL
jgi:hypothetical protein